MRIMGEGIYAYDDDGIVVSIPPEMSNIIPRRLELQWSPDMWRQKNFRPLRLVMNLKLEDITNPEISWLKFSLPVQVQVYYGLAEKIQAMQEGSKPTLAYWQNNLWNLIDTVEDVHPVMCQGWDGFLKFEIFTWEDPTIAVGY